MTSSSPQDLPHTAPTGGSIPAARSESMLRQSMRARMGTRISSASVARIAALVGILGLAALLRFHSIQLRGLIYWDEGKYALEGVRVLGAIEHPGRLVGKGIGSARPTHDLFIALSYAVLGVRDSSGLMMSAAAGLICVLLTYLIASRLFSPRVGLIAALFLAVGEYELLYARSLYPEDDGNMLLLLGVLLWLAAAGSPVNRGAQRSSDAAGLWTRVSVLPPAMLMGVAFTANFRLSPYVATFVCMDLWYQLRAGERGLVIRRALLWGVGLAMAPIVWEVAARLSAAHGVPLFRGDRTGNTSYIRQAIGDLIQGNHGAAHFEPLLYLQWYFVRQRLPMTVLLFAGLGIAAWRRSFSWLVPTLPIAVAIAIFVVGPFPQPRNMSASLSLASILAAATIDLAAGTVTTLRGPLLAAATLAVSLPMLPGAWHVGEVRSGFARASSYLQTQPPGRVVSTTEIMAFYLHGPGTGCTMIGMPLSLPMLSAYVRAGYRYAVLEAHHTSQVTYYIRDHARLLARYSADGAPPLGEALIASENSSPPRPAVRPDDVYVFSLGGMHLPKPHGLAIRSCDLDRVPP